MNPVPHSPDGLIVSGRISVFFAGLILLAAPNLQAEALPITPRIQRAGADVEGLETFQLEWDALSNTTYRVQAGNFGTTPGLNGNSLVWQTIDTVQPLASLGNYQLKITPRDEFGNLRSNAFFRLILPQPEIFSVEPAVVDVGVSNAPLYILGQSLPTNALVLINGQYFTPTIINTGGVWAVVSLNGLPPGVPWLGVTVVDAGTSNVIATLPNSVLGVDASSPYLLEPPELPPASPETGASSLTAAQCQYFATKDKVTICHATSSPRKPYTRINNPANSGDGDAIRENDNVVFDVQEGKKGLNAVNVKLARSSGEVQQQAVDLAVAGRGLDFVWARTYRSRSGSGSSLGPRWTHSYDVNIQPLGGDIVIHDGTGRADRFFLQTNGTFTCPQFFREGTLTSGVFRLTFADTGYWEFNPTGGSPSAGKLALIVDRNGNTMSLAYDGSGRLAKVVDALGRTNSIGYNGSGQLTSVTDFSGRTVTYRYYSGLPADPGGSAGDLRSVTSPPVTGTPNGNDFPTGKTTTYTYSTGYANELENHLLLSVIDANGQTTHRHVYQHNQSDFDFLRCTSTQRWTNTPARLSYLPQTPTPANQFATLRCVMNDPVGNVMEYFYDARNRCVKLQEFTGRATPGMPVTATVNRPTGKLRSSDPDSYVTRWSWNNDSLCTLEVAPGGQQLRCIYESDFDKSTRARKRADCRVVRELASGGGVDLDGDGVADLTERVSRYEYDPRFGSEPSARNSEHGCPACPHPGLGPGSMGNRKGWDGTIKGRFAGGPRQSTSLVQDFEKNTENVSGGFGVIDTGDGGGGFVTAMTDPRGYVTLASYDEGGNCTEVRSADYYLDPQNKPRVTMAYNSHGQLTAITNAADANGRRRVDTFEYYTSGQQSGFLRIREIDSAPNDGRHIRTTYEYDPRGNVTRLIDPRTNDWLFTYNALDQCVRAQTPTNITARSATDFFYDENNNLFTVSGTVRDRFDNPVLDQVNRFQYDPLHRLTRGERAVSASQSLTNDFVYDGNDQLLLARGGDAVSGADPHQAIAYQCDERGSLFRATGAPGSPHQTTTQYDYDSNGNTIRVTKGLEGVPSVTTFEYDGLIDMKDQSLKKVLGTFTLVGCGLKKFDWAPKLEGGKEGLAWVETVWNKQCVEKDTTVRLSKVTDPMGNVTTFNYDANDNLKVIRHFGQTNDVPGTNGNILLAKSRYEYDPLDRLTAIRCGVWIGQLAEDEPFFSSTSFAYAPNGQCTNVTDDLGRATSYTYDTAGRSASVSSPGGKTVMVCLKDAAGNVTRIAQTDQPDLGGAPQVFSRTNVYDSLNRRVSTTDNVGNNENWAFDSLGRVVQTTDPRGNRSFYEYDLLGRRTLAVRDLDGDGVPQLATDYSERATWSTSNGRLLATMDSHDNITSYAYDSLGRCTNVTHADGTQRNLVWSPRSNLIQETDANGTVAVHTYDLNDRCVSNSYAPGSTVAANTTFEQYAYDGSSRLVRATDDGSVTTFTYDSLGNRTRDISGGLGAVVTFDSLGNRLSLTYPGGRALTYAYDVLDQCTNILETGVSLANFAYAGPGRVSRISHGNGMRTGVSYNGITGTQNAQGDFGRGEISSILHAMVGGQPRVGSVTLKWDRSGNKTSREDARFPPAVPRVQSRTLDYDPADRLVNSVVLSNSVLVDFSTYGLDRMGNRTNINRAFCSGNYFLASLPPALDFQMNQYTATPCDARTYDQNGNLASVSAGPVSAVSYTYDCHDRLVFVSDSGAPVASYHYDALGRRIAKTVFSGGLPPVTTEFIYDGRNVIEERVNGAVTASFVLDATRSQDDGVIQMQRGGQTYYYHTDDQGNVLALTTTGGTVVERYDYDDYGRVTFLTGDGVPTSATSSAVGNGHCWGGLRLDAETGLYNDDGGGYYEPQTARTLFGLVGHSVSTGAIRGRALSGNNPWSGGSPNAMKNGTVKFFNEAKGFGRVGGGGGGVCAIESRDTLKTFFETGDVATQDQRLVSRNILKSFFIPGAKPSSAQFGTLIDSTLNVCPGGGRVWPRAGYWSASGRASKNMTLKGQKILQN